MFAFGALIAAAWVLGQVFTRPLRLDHATERATLRVLAGLCLAGALVVAMGSWSLPWACAALYAVTAAGLAAEVFRPASKGEVAPVAVPPEPLDLLEKAALAATGISLLVALLAASAPVTDWDAATAHLALPAAYARDGRIHLDPGNVFSAHPHLVHSLYAAAFHGGGEVAVSWLNWAWGALGALAVFQLGRRAVSRRVGLVASAVFATAPVFMTRAAAPSMDLAFAALATTALWAVLGWFDTRRAPWLVLAAFFAGSACGVLHIGYILCALLFVAVLAGTRARRLRSVALFAGVTVLAAAPWLLRSALAVGNPFFPLFDSFFPVRGIAYPAPESMADPGLPRLLRLPWDLVMRPNAHGGWALSPGGLVLVLGVPGLIVGSWRVRWLGLYAVAGLYAVCFCRPGTVHALPFLVPMMVAAGAAAESLRAWRKPLSAFLCLVFAFHVTLNAAAMHRRVPVLVGKETRTEYLRALAPRYRAFEYANENLRDGRILTPDPRSAYLRMPAFQNREALLRLAELPPESQWAWLRDNEIRYLLVPWTCLEECPGDGRKLIALFRRWTDDETRFTRVKELSLPRLDGPGLDRVAFYEVRAD
jgi:hypothetical protein